MPIRAFARSSSTAAQYAALHEDGRLETRPLDRDEKELCLIEHVPYSPLASSASRARSAPEARPSATRVSEEIGFAYVDEQIVRSAAEKAESQSMSSSGAEQRKKLAGRLLEELTGSLAGSIHLRLHDMTPPEAVAASDDYRDLIQQAIQETADTRRRRHRRACRLVRARRRAGRAARAGHRLSRVARPQRLVEEGRSEAEAEGAGRRRATVRAPITSSATTGSSEELPTHYDLVANTDRLSRRRRRGNRPFRRRGRAPSRFWTGVAVAPMLGR